MDKLLNPDTPIRQQIEQQVKSAKLVRTIKIHKGHKIFRYNPETSIIEEAQYTNIRTDIYGAAKKDLLVEPGWLYESALNVASAERKFAKRMGVQLEKGHKPKAI